jgi:transposase
MTQELHRKKRKTVTKEIIKSVRKSMCKEFTLKNIAEEAEISYFCAYKLVEKIQNGMNDEEILNTKKGRPSTVNVILTSKVRNLLAQNPASTLKMLKESLQNENCMTSKATISRAIKNMNYTRKRLSKVPEERNSIGLINLRQEYCRGLESIPDPNLVFLDETGFCLHQTKKYGYSLKNTKCFLNVPANRGRNVSLMCAINLMGVIGFEMKEGAFDGNSFLQFIEEKLVPYFRGNRGSILIMDNCRFHHRLDVKQFLIEKNILFMYLPAYSPQLNPIEEFFSYLKSKYTDIQPLSRNKNEIINRVSNIFENDVVCFLGWFRHMRVWIERGLSRQVFE